MAFTHIWSLCRRLKNGVYKKKNALDDDFSVISLNNKQVVFSFHTALYLLGFNDRIPNIFHISVPQGYNVKHIKRKCSNIKVHYVKRDLFYVGVIEIKTPLGSQVECYNMERCICDIVSERKSVDKQTFTDAIIGYFKSRDKNIRNLIKYSRLLGIEDEIRKYTEILQMISSESLKGKIRNIANSKKIRSQEVLQKFFFERKQTLTF